MSAICRLHAVQRAFSGSDKALTSERRRILVLPDDAPVEVASPSSNLVDTFISGQHVLTHRILPRTLALVISAIGTPYEDAAHHIPKFPVLELIPPPDTSTITIADCWGAIYALWTLYHVQETIPILLAPAFANHVELREYILHAGLGRTQHTLSSVHPVSATPELFLSRGAFWQGGGTTGYHARGWLNGSPPVHLAPFPAVQSFTRTPLVITAHPLRPPKPRPGEILYKRFCPATGRVLEMAYFDPGGAGEVSAHLAAFHKWHNDERVNKGWMEQGSIEKHRAYVRATMENPAVVPVMMSWDGELMGYVEYVWIKENHVAQYVPDGAKDYDRGIHVLVGEDKFRGTVNSETWLRAVCHYCFLADPRTERIIGEPKAENQAIIDTSFAAGLHIQTMFDFPYKRSVMTWSLRERFFKMDML